MHRRLISLFILIILSQAVSARADSSLICTHGLLMANGPTPNQPPEMFVRQNPTFAIPLIKKLQDPNYAIPAQIYAELTNRHIIQPTGKVASIITSLLDLGLVAEGNAMLTTKKADAFFKEYYEGAEDLIEYMMRIYRGHYVMLKHTTRAVDPTGLRAPVTESFVLRVRDKVPYSLVTALGELHVYDGLPESLGRRNEAFETLKQKLSLNPQKGAFSLGADDEVFIVRMLPSGAVDWPVNLNEEKWAFGTEPALDLWARVKPSFRQER